MNNMHALIIMECLYIVDSSTSHAIPRQVDELYGMAVWCVCSTYMLNNVNTYMTYSCYGIATGFMLYRCVYEKCTKKEKAKKKKKKLEFEA